MRIPSRLTTKRRLANESFCVMRAANGGEGSRPDYAKPTSRPSWTVFTPTYREGAPKRSDGGLAIQLKSAIGYLLSAISWALCHSLLLWCLQALFESSCEIDHLGGRRSFGRSLDFLALGFRIDHFLDLLSVGVLVFLRIELIGQALNQFERKIYLALRDFLLFRY